MAAAVLLAACGNGGSAAAGPGKAAQISAGKLDVAGVRPGMSAGEAASTLKGAGWRVETFPGLDWKVSVEREAARQRNKQWDNFPPKNGVETIQAHKGDEEIIALLKASPSGSIVNQVGYSAPMAGRTGEQVRAQMVQRYGQPSKQSPAGAPLLEMTWCTGGENCRQFATAKPSLLVKEDVYHKLIISMSEGGDAEKARQAQLLAAASGGAAPKLSF